MNGIVYSQFERGYKKYRKVEIVPVEIINNDDTKATELGIQDAINFSQYCPSAKSKLVQNMESHYLNALEIGSSIQKSLAEMERADYLNQIKH